MAAQSGVSYGQPKIIPVCQKHARKHNQLAAWPRLEAMSNVSSSNLQAEAEGNQGESGIRVSFERLLHIALC